MPKDPFTILQGSSFPELFEQAENAIKKVEWEDSKLHMPAVNELRYAAYHIKNFIKNPANKDEIRQAEGHCKRAIYDAVEASIIFHVESFKKFQDDYRKIVITEVVREYPEYKKRINKIVSFIRPVDKENKEEIYQKCLKYNEEIKEITATLDAAREELNKVIRKERARTQRNTILVIAGILSVIIGLIALFKCGG